MSINDKIKEVLTRKNLSPSHLADDIGVQRSSISHILSGRNRPSLDIIQKIVRRFPEFSYDWFLEDDTQMSTELPAAVTPQVSLRRTSERSFPSSQPRQVPSVSQTVDQFPPVDQNNETIVPKRNLAGITPAVERILIFYADGTFREYIPA